MSGIEFDFSELNEFAIDIQGADTRVRRNVTTVIKTGAFKAKKAWSASARSQSGRSLGGYPASIDYDLEGIGAGNRSGEISAEVGPSLGGQGSLAIVEETPGGVRGKPQRNVERIEKAIAEDLVKGILIAVGDDGMGGS